MNLLFDSEVKRGAPKRSRLEPARFAAHAGFEPRLQRAVGNQAVQELLRGGWIHAKGTVGNIDDPGEREAEHIAARVLRSEVADEVPARSAEGHTIHQALSANNALMDAPGILGRLLHSGGRPLDQESRAFFEPRFGQDFSHVRIHTGAEAADSARSINARAYTAGEHIVFADAFYTPSTAEGRGLIAHELAHVVQQRVQDSSTGNGSSRRSRPLIQRSPSPQGHVIFPPTSFSADSATERSRWRAAVDRAVRKQFGLSGPGIEDAQVHYDSAKDFGVRFQGQSLEDALVTTFLDGGNITARNILLSDERVAYLARYADPITDLGMLALRDFVREGIKNNSFKDSGGGPLDLSTSKPMYPPSTITPSELVASEFAGLTTSTGPRSSRRIDLLPGASSGRSVYVGVFVHEACHFYAHDAYNSMISGIEHSDDAIGGARIGQILAEGIAEFFAREVSKANEDDFGDLILAYPAETEQAARLVALCGEKTVQDAYFRGNASALKQIATLVEQWRKDRFPDPIEAEKLLDPSHK